MYENYWNGIMSDIDDQLNEKIKELVKKIEGRSFGIDDFDISNIVEDDPEYSKTFKSIMTMLDVYVKKVHPECYAEYSNIENKKKGFYALSKFKEFQINTDLELVGQFNINFNNIFDNISLKDFIHQLAEISNPNIPSIVNNATFSMIILQRLALNSDISKEEISIQLMDHYKKLVEGIFQFFTDVVTYLLILYGHRYFESGRSVPIGNLADCRKRDLGPKLIFISTHGFRSFSDSCNKQLRNSTSHEKYRTTEDGSIIYWDRRGNEYSITQVELHDTINRIMTATHAMENSLLSVFIEQIRVNVLPKSNHGQMLK
jgi:hypothetical protein